MARRRSARRAGGSRGRRLSSVIATSASGGGETNLGAVLKRALAGEAGTESRTPTTRSSQTDQETQHCYNCWHAITYTDEKGHLMAKCEMNLWVRPVYTHEELNQDKVRRWHAACPEYDDSE